MLQSPAAPGIAGDYARTRGRAPPCAAGTYGFDNGIQPAPCTQLQSTVWVGLFPLTFYRPAIQFVSSARFEPGPFAGIILVRQRAFLLFRANHYPVPSLILQQEHR